MNEKPDDDDDDDLTKSNWTTYLKLILMHGQKKKMFIDANKYRVKGKMQGVICTFDRWLCASVH